jgi:hypothetical protein
MKALYHLSAENEDIFLAASRRRNENEEALLLGKKRMPEDLKMTARLKMK